ncbi:MAG: endolytic transglycosylase MltG [Hyphomicrobiaceae bacterium]
MTRQKGRMREMHAGAPILPRSPSEVIEPTRAPTRRGKRRRRESQPMGATMRWLNGVFTLVLLAMLGGAGVIVWFDYEIDRPGPLAKTQLVRIAPGSGERAIALLLEQKGIVSSRHVFYAYHLTYNLLHRFQGRKSETLKAGDYRIDSAATVRKIAGIIRKGKADLLSVSIPEGLTSYQIVERLRANDELDGELSEIPAEGFLLPDTYLVPRGTKRRDVLNLMADAQRNFLRKVWEKRDASIPLRNVSEALILASIIEKETGPRDDPKRISGVFVNRLRKGMRLQSDPTILYGKFGTKVRWGSTIYRSDIRRATSHNTYQIDGLPPTPICNPGRASIEAAVRPASTKDLFFVADGKGGHVFSETVEQHNRAVAQWRKIERRIREAQRQKELTRRAKTASRSAQNAQLSTQTAAKVVRRDTEPLGASSEMPAVSERSDGIPLPERRPSR